MEPRGQLPAWARPLSPAERAADLPTLGQGWAGTSLLCLLEAGSICWVERCGGHRPVPVRGRLLGVGPAGW